ncbi:type II secretion system F family protein [Humisphaera borealis]|uniref:General secretion pathway protein F n=1 Tax=Humisphaera borealis TaxID=2807512 RepID=A0A7M2WWG9_9BACT|nr:type II secretion system F family protein [Humisphaera borealis]QOV89816.1 type II secretion system F family protein [Humisphaera borealis]
MATFAYTAISRDGKRTAGTLSADSRASAITQVTRQGLHPLKIDETRNGASVPVAAPAKRVTPPPGKKGASKDVAPAKAPDGKASADASPGGLFAARINPNRVSGKLVEGFTRELANLLAGGVSLARALGLLKREASNPNAKALWNAIHDDVVGGTALADSMAKYPKAFSTVYIAMVRAGEAGGFLDVVLQQIADFRTREADLKGKVKAAMVYPIVLAVLSVVVVIFLLSFFIPKFAPIFDQFGGKLPTLTKMIIAASDLVKGYGPYLAVGGVIVGVMYYRWIKSDSGRRRVELITLAVPVLGRVIAHFALVRFCRMLGTLVGAGVPLVSSLKTAREAIGNQTLADTVSHAIEQVQRGEALSKSLANSPLFPASVVETIAVAEETGRLDKELVRVATSYEGDLDRQLRMLVAIAEPVLLIIMASVIGLVVVGMLLPVFNMSELIK